MVRPKKAFSRDLVWGLARQAEPQAFCPVLPPEFSGLFESVELHIHDDPWDVFVALS